MAKLTITDIARMANVSPSTVSFVLNNRPGIREETRKHVKAIIEQTGYTPNAHSRRLTLRRSFTIHVVMRHYTSTLFNLFGTDVLMGIFRESRRLGYNIIFTSVDEAENIRDSFKYVRETITSETVDGVMFIQCFDPELLQLCKDQGLPFLLVDCNYPKDHSVPLVEVDYYDAALQAANYLISCGHHDIGFIGTNSMPEFDRMTFGGFRDALNAAGLPIRMEWVQKNSDVNVPTPSCMQNILSCKLRPTAILCAADIYAIEAIKQAKKAGFSVPEDISFMGIDDLVVAEYVNPALSTMAMDKLELGSLSMRQLYAMINKQPCETISLVKTKLCIRDTVYRRK